MRNRVIVILILFCFLFSSCVTFRLEKRLKKLNPAISEWYEYHRILMETKVPEWIDDRGGKENTHFLRLPQELQLAYITVFWKMRIEGLREEYYNRMATANRSFNEGGKPGWKTDRGLILLLCGAPNYISFYPIYPLYNEDSSIEGYRYEVWNYYQRGMMVRYVFKYRAFNTWCREYSSLFSQAGQTAFERQCRKLFASTEEGWDLWGSILLRWVKANEKL